MGGTYASDETAKYLSNIALNSGYTKDEYYIFAATGSKDIAYEHLRDEINSMKNYTEAFTYTTDNFSNGKLMFYDNVCMCSFIVWNIDWLPGYNL